MLIHERLRSQEDLLQKVYEFLQRVRDGESPHPNETDLYLHGISLWIAITGNWRSLLRRSLDRGTSWRGGGLEIDPRPIGIVENSALFDVYSVTIAIQETAEEKKRDQSLPEFERATWQGKADAARIILAEMRRYPNAIISKMEE